MYSGKLDRTNDRTQIRNRWILREEIKNKATGIFHNEQNKRFSNICIGFQTITLIKNLLKWSENSRGAITLTVLYRRSHFDLALCFVALKKQCRNGTPRASEQSWFAGSFSSVIVYIYFYNFSDLKISLATMLALIMSSMRHYQLCSLCYNTVFYRKWWKLNKKFFVNNFWNTFHAIVKVSENVFIVF